MFPTLEPGHAVGRRLERKRKSSARSSGLQLMTRQQIKTPTNESWRISMHIFTPTNHRMFKDDNVESLSLCFIVLIASINFLFICCPFLPWNSSMLWRCCCAVGGGRGSMSPPPLPPITHFWKYVTSQSREREPAGPTHGHMLPSSLLPQMLVCVWGGGGNGSNLGSLNPPLRL